MTQRLFTRRLTTTLLTGILSAANVLSAGDIVKDGKPNARIVIAEKPTRMQWMAAFELRDYLKKISGAELPILNEPADDAEASQGMAIEIYVGDGRGARAKGVSAEGLANGAYRIVAGKNWLALVGNDKDFKPIEPWGRHHGHGQNTVIPEWDRMTGAKWKNAMATSLYRNYTGKGVNFEKDQAKMPTSAEDIQFWRFDKKGSLNAVYAFLRSLGIRWYMPGEIGEIVPQLKTIELPTIDRTVQPDVKSRSMSWDRYGVSREHIMWSLRLGLSHIFGPLHHGIANVIARDEQRKLHPEFYAVLANGERDLEARRPQTCLSCPGLLKENIEYVKANFDIYDVPIVSVMPQDGFTRICQCEKCRNKPTLEQGDSGRFSNYVWSYVNKVAREVAKTHPDKRIICGAYSTYQEPPNEIDKLEPNVLVQITNGRPRTEMDPEFHKKLDDMRRGWLEKTDNPLAISINHHVGYLPFYVPHVIARGLKDAKGQIWREDLWFMPFGREGLYKSAINHLGVYVAARLWWEQDRDVDELLDEYYDLFYGPARDEMETFVEYVEANYGDLTQNRDKVNKAFELFDAVKERVDPETVYGKRVARIDETLADWRKRRDQLAKERDNTLEFSELLNYDKQQEQYLKPRTTFVFDGKLDEPFWTVRPRGAGLKRVGGGKPEHTTSFMARWYRNHLYLGIRCNEDMASPLNVTTTERDNPAILDGDHVQLLLETADHAHYQVAVNPAGALLDRDLGVEEAGWNRWDAQAEAVIHKGDGFWSVELRLPITTSDNDPLHQVIGKPPTGALPWFFNVCRKRVRGADVEVSSFSPVVGEGDVDDPTHFAKMMLRGTNKKARRARKLAKDKASQEN